MIIGIEGTGSQGWDQTEFRRSFVRKVLHQAGDPERYYFIGPNDQGSDGAQIVDGAWELLYRRGIMNSRIVLVGYSRGAAYCMKLAEMWRDHWKGARKIDCLVMFDAVARNQYSSSGVMGSVAQVAGWKEVSIAPEVASCVSVCIHAVRNPQASSRAAFGNTGLEVASPRQTKFLFNDHFFCSHGAMGGTSYDAQSEEGLTDKFGYAAMGAGVDSNAILNSTFDKDPRYQTRQAGKFPVPTKAQDDAGMRQVGQWMWARMKEFGVLADSCKSTDNAGAFSGSCFPGMYNKVK